MLRLSIGTKLRRMGFSDILGWHRRVIALIMGSEARPKRVHCATFVALLAATVIGLTGCDDAPSPKKQNFTIGLVTNNPNGLKNIQGFKTGMATLGYVKGKKVNYVGPDKPVRGKHLKEALSEMVTAKVDLIFTAGTPTGIAAYKATKGSKIPVVFGVIADPIAAGVLTDLTKPGGNMTGVMLNRDQGRRLEILLQLIPNIKRIAILFNPNDFAPVSAVKQLEISAKRLNIDLVKLRCPDSPAVTKCLTEIPNNIDAIFMVPDSVVNKRVKDIVKLANARKLPLTGPSTAQINQGALLTYGFIHGNVGAQAARIAHEIFAGTNAGGIPVETAESPLGLNLITAAKIGLKVPAAFLRKAEIIVRKAP